MLSIQIDISKGEFPDLTPGNISRLTRSVASRVRTAVINATPVGNRPLKGRKRTKKQWTPVRKGDGGYSFGNPTPQSAVLEYGSALGQRPWPNPKERTVYNEGRVYSSQAPSGILNEADAYNLANQVASELFKLMVEGKSIAKG